MLDQIKENSESLSPLRTAIRSGNISVARKCLNKGQKLPTALEAMTDAYTSNDAEMIFFISRQYKRQELSRIQEDLIRSCVKAGSNEGALLLRDEFYSSSMLTRIWFSNASGYYGFQKKFHPERDVTQQQAAARAAQAWEDADKQLLTEEGRAFMPKSLLKTETLDELRNIQEYGCCGLLVAAKTREFNFVVQRMTPDNPLTVADMLRRDENGHTLYRILSLSDQMGFMNDDKLWQGCEEERLAIIYRLPHYNRYQISEELCAKADKLSYEDYARHIPHETGVQDNHINKLRNKRPIRPKNSGF